LDPPQTSRPPGRLDYPVVVGLLLLLLECFLFLFSVVFVSVADVVAVVIVIGSSSFSLEQTKRNRSFSGGWRTGGRKDRRNGWLPKEDDPGC
jgi:hypothetical protein